MQIVIDIPEEDYKDIIENGLCGYSSVRENVSNAIKESTPLPKGHGRLIDTKILNARIFDLPKPQRDSTYWDGVDDVGDLITSTPTIIEAEE